MIEEINAKADYPRYNVVGFISNKPDPFESTMCKVPVIGTIDKWIETKNNLFVMAIRDPYRKKAAVQQLKKQGAQFETIIAPWVLLPFEFEAGEGCIIGNYNFKQNSRFGDFVIMDAAMCESVEIGDYSTLCPFVNITSATIGKSVYVGSHAAIMSHLNVGDGSYIFPGSIVVKNVKPGSVLAGVPATSIAAKKWIDRRNNV